MQQATDFLVSISATAVTALALIAMAVGATTDGLRILAWVIHVAVCAAISMETAAIWLVPLGSTVDILANAVGATTNDLRIITLVERGA